MPLQNRVQPDGQIIAHPTRGALMGNRGILHGAHQNLGRARWRHKAWVTCVLTFEQRRRALMQPGHYTELFFYDEAVAFAAGHRPCAECRRADYNRFRHAAGITGRIADFDTILHAARTVPRVYGQKRHLARIDDLPAGSFIIYDAGQPHLVRNDALVPFLPKGYGTAQPRPCGVEVTVLTPAPLLEVLRAGYVVQTAPDTTLA